MSIRSHWGLKTDRRAPGNLCFLGKMCTSQPFGYRSANSRWVLGFFHASCACGNHCVTNLSAAARQSIVGVHIFLWWPAAARVFQTSLCYWDQRSLFFRSWVKERSQKASLSPALTLSPHTPSVCFGEMRWCALKGCEKSIVAIKMHKGAASELLFSNTLNNEVLALEVT